MTDDRTVEEWLDAAVAEIAFRPDRKAVRAELAAHLEDAADEQQRLFPEMDREEAEARAVARMGDPEEVGRELSMVHKPWLGWLWRVSRVLACVTLIFSLLYLISPYNWIDCDGIWGTRGRWHGSDRGQSAQLGGYTFQVTGASIMEFSRYPEGDDLVNVGFRVSTPRFWEQVSWNAVTNAVTLVDPQGGRWSKTIPYYPDSEDRPWTTMVDEARWGLFYREFNVSFFNNELQMGDRMTLEFQFDQGSFALQVPITERVVVE